MKSLRTALAGVSLLALGACAYMPQENLDRQIEISDIKAAVDCEVVAAVRILGPKVFTIGKWDVKSGLELTLVEQVSADGRVTWAIPIANSLTPSVNFAHKKTSIAHLDFVTIITDAMLNPRSNCEPGLDPSGTGLGLTSWIVSTFRGVTPQYYGGSSYTRIFELTAGGGPRFGFAFLGAPVTGEIGASVTRIGTHQISITVSPSIPPGPDAIKVIIVEDRTKTSGERSLQPGRRGGRGDSAPMSRRDQIISNPIGNQLLRQQSPIRLLPGTTLTPTR